MNITTNPKTTSKQINPSTFTPTYSSNHNLNSIVNKEYDSNLDVINKYNENIVKIRSDLDAKLNDIYETNNSVFNDSYIQYDGAIYSGILWTILASSVVFLIITRG
jgi:hypothetical protein